MCSGQSHLNTRGALRGPIPRQIGQNERRLGAFAVMFELCRAPDIPSSPQNFQVRLPRPCVARRTATTATPPSAGERTCGARNTLTRPNPGWRRRRSMSTCAGRPRSPTGTTRSSICARSPPIGSYPQITTPVTGVPASNAARTLQNHSRKPQRSPQPAMHIPNGNCRRPGF